MESYITYYPEEDSVVKSKKEYKNGKIDGESVFYYKDGQLSYSKMYNSGAPTGKWEYFHSNGQLSQTGKHVGGQKDGLWQYFLDEGQKQAEILYDKGTELIVVEYDRFGGAKDEEKEAELNQMLSKRKADAADANSKKKKPKKKKGKK